MKIYRFYKSHYIVSGLLSGRRMDSLYNTQAWFSGYKPSKWFSWGTCVACKTKAHALAQYRRLKVGVRQIDIRGDGRGKVWKFDEKKSPKRKIN